LKNLTNRKGQSESFGLFKFKSFGRKI